MHVLSWLWGIAIGLSVLECGQVGRIDTATLGVVAVFADLFFDVPSWNIARWHLMTLVGAFIPHDV